MLLNDGRTSSCPRILVALTLIFMVFRIGLLTYERFHPPAVTDFVQWNSPDHLPSKPDSGKMYLYWFTADWCVPCKQLEQNAFQNRDVVAMIEKNFLPVKVVDRKQEDGKNSSQVQVLEGKYHLIAFPMLVTALPDTEMDRVAAHAGGVSAKSVLQFLQRSLRDAPFRSGMRKFIDGQWSEGILTLRSWLGENSWTDSRSSYAALYTSAACINNHDEPGARQILQEATEKATTKYWPHQLFGYLDQTKDKIIELADEDPTNLSDAHYFAGIYLLSKNDTKAARSQFEWVKNHGTKDQYPYELAVTQLKQAVEPNSKDSKDSKDSK